MFVIVGIEIVGNKFHVWHKGRIQEFPVDLLLHKDAGNLTADEYSFLKRLRGELAALSLRGTDSFVIFLKFPEDQDVFLQDLLSDPCLYIQNYPASADLLFDTVKVFYRHGSSRRKKILDAVSIGAAKEKVLVSVLELLVDEIGINVVKVIPRDLVLLNVIAKLGIELPVLLLDTYDSEYTGLYIYSEYEGVPIVLVSRRVFDISDEGIRRAVMETNISTSKLYKLYPESVVGIGPRIVSEYQWVDTVQVSEALGGVKI